MKLPKLQNILDTNNLRIIVNSKELAQLGDFLANFIYSTARMGFFEKNNSIHVWDSSLKNAMDLSNLRKAFGKRTKPDKVADGAEALIAYVYFNRIYSIDEMIEILRKEMEQYNTNLGVKEKELCGQVFSKLLDSILSTRNDWQFP